MELPRGSFLLLRVMRKKLSYPAPAPSAPQKRRAPPLDEAPRKAAKRPRKRGQDSRVEIDQAAWVEASEIKSAQDTNFDPPKMKTFWVLFGRCSEWGTRTRVVF